MLPFSSRSSTFGAYALPASHNIASPSALAFRASPAPRCQSYQSSSFSKVTPAKCRPSLNSLFQFPTSVFQAAALPSLLPLSPFRRATIYDSSAVLGSSTRLALCRSCSLFAAIARSSARIPSNNNVIYPFVTHPASPPLFWPQQVIHRLSTIKG